MASILRALGRRAASTTTTTVVTRAAGLVLRSAPTGLGSTAPLALRSATAGLVLYGGTVSSHSPPPAPALCRGDPFSFHFGARSSLPPVAVADKIVGTACLPATGACAGAPCLPATGSAAGAPCLPATGSAAGAPSLHQGTAAGAANSRARLGGGASWLRPAAITNFPSSSFVLPASPSSVVRPFSTTRFNSIFSIERKLDQMQESASSRHKEIVALLDKTASAKSESQKTLSTSQKKGNMRSLSLRYICRSIAVYSAIGLVLLCAWSLAKSALREKKDDFIEILTTVLHGVLQNPDIKKAAESYAAILGCAIRRSLLSWRNPSVMSKEEFSAKISSFAMAALTLSINGKSEEKLVLQLKQIGFGDRAMIMAMLHFLTKHGYITKETRTFRSMMRKRHSVHYSSSMEAIDKCIKGEIKMEICKTVAKEASMEEMLQS